MAFPNPTTPSPGTAMEYNPTMDMDSSTGEGSNQATPPTPSYLGSPYGYESIQGTDSIMATLGSPSLAQQNQAIFALLVRGATLEFIFHYVETFKHMVWSNDIVGLAFMALSGNLQDLAIMAVIPAEELVGRILHVLHLSAHPFIEPPPNVACEPIDDSRPSTNAGPSDETTPPPQASKKPRASRKGKEPAQQAIVRRGCPGNGWKCKPHEESTRKYWDSKTGFETHFTAIHMEGCADGFRWKCPLHVRGCARSFAGNGSDLLDHLWFDHWEPVEPSQ
ncbi:uncharacterized protein J4E78_008258 [Alternaria triticimaculans]|uniref:uncharacterized protein n=1 Tax=Alternaria triticimaculans TaxID=297637 RepID=UPI0020C29641|nr:uncharacterized protein J4E78_008258 [Alternaria triticimaculans]KAI4649977.1 hypothetical protein J4E78_008258 [Alternaria triticimaculans]